jgi:hypothetical protein
MNAIGRGYRARMFGRSGSSRRASAMLAGLVAALASTGLVGCTTGSPTSTSGWQSATDRVLGEAISGLGTARIAVQQEQRDRLPHSYAVVTATDAIETSGKEISGYEVAQPPDDLHEANAVVGDALDRATSLMVEVRVTLASPGLTAASARRLVTRIDDLRDELDQLSSDVQESPESVGAR